MPRRGVATPVYLSLSQVVHLGTTTAPPLPSHRARTVWPNSSAEEERTHMLPRLKYPTVLPSLVAAGLLAAACSDQPNVNMTSQRPNFWLTPPPAQCVTGKWTGGGRIDPTGNRLASNYDNVDEPAGGQPVAPDPAPYMTGKVTFGFNVFLGQDADGNCIVKKGEIEVNGHALKIAWHVSIHDGVDAYDGRPVFANEFSDGHPGGVCVVVGVPDNFMTAREKGPGATESSELTQFEVCDNRSEEHTSELQSHSFISYAVFCLKKKNKQATHAKQPVTAAATGPRRSLCRA